MARRGSVYRRSDGRWAGSVQIDGQRRTVYGRSEREARAKLKALLAQAEAGALPAVHPRTLAHLVETWLANDPAMRDTTKQSNRQFLSRYILPALGPLRIDRITPELIQQTYAGLSPSVAHRAHAALRRAFAVAVLWRWLHDNPCLRVTLPAYTPVPRPLWSAAELGIFRAAIVGYWLEPLFTVLLTSGLRIGEALALQWPNVRAGALRVNGTLRYQAGRPVLNPPKSRAGRRTVLLPPAGLTALDAQRQQQADWRAKAGKRWPPGEFVFTKRDGRPLTVSTPHAALRRFCAQLNLPPLTPHGLRHLHASLLIQEGVPVTAIAARLGHSSPAITLRVYAHALTGQDERAAAAIAAALGE